MYTIEFETDAKDRMIEIPQEFELFASKHLKVMLSIDEFEIHTQTKPVKRVSALSLDTRDFKFDREEANVR
jgi:hypothetical protein